MYCEACGARADTKYVAFYQNIGALILRFSSSTKGNLCKSCIHQTFWSYTAINCLLGWWGIISFCITPFFILNNIIQYVPCLGMAAPDASPPSRTRERVTATPRRGDGKDECYTCGRPLEPDEVAARVCRFCRA
jgi:hypothetical protein